MQKNKSLLSADSVLEINSQLRCSCNFRHRLRLRRLLDVHMVAVSNFFSAGKMDGVHWRNRPYAMKQAAVCNEASGWTDG